MSHFDRPYYAATPAMQRGYERRGRFAGLGPKGYRRAQVQLQEEIRDRLRADHRPEDDVENVSGVRQDRLRVGAGEGYDERGTGGSGRYGAHSEAGASDGQRSAADRTASH